MPKMLRKRYKKLKRWYSGIEYVFDWKVSAILTMGAIIIYLVLFG